LLGDSSCVTRGQWGGKKKKGKEKEKIRWPLSCRKKKGGGVSPWGGKKAS